ncbi:hypothetical protein FPF71_06755 [Algibacter amylolyticus]|uniref:GNAT family N-acetyltransferase n=1 Tax=Algibacter amylolyticus TaxID=1608400 RepID=A0A5M7B867_9FLAO|nr:hypothetical protein [Algibacter amylolyticus]KAA5825602.1 hypothetical protein F2B50_06755 [Algibacter amylolyticus]MBB5268172.1 hypothetical protein [Algibacter amylolyticus]TSJ79900.1 hypothetical protein FPF71_06755 [Algibacter amylolyticus]
MSEDLEIINLTKSKLREHIENNTFWKSGVAPMAKSKAIWLVSNNRIEEEDSCGILAWENSEMVAFIYMFPDLINTTDQPSKKVYWMIDWWVVKRYKDSILGTYIYDYAVKLVQNQVVIKGYTENVQEFYDKRPFSVIASRLRHTIFFSLDRSMLLGRFPFLKPIKFLMDIIDGLTGKIVRFINRNKLGKKTEALTYEFINELDKATWDFIKPLCTKDLILKTKDYVNWQLSNTQYLQVPVNHKRPYTNLQPGVSDNIRIHNLKIMKNDVVIGFLSYIINYNEFNVKYFLVEDPDNYDLCVDVLMENLLKSKRNFIFTDDTELSDNLNKRYFTVFTHKVRKKGLVHNDTVFDYNSLTMFNRDGHFY